MIIGKWPIPIGEGAICKHVYGADAYQGMADYTGREHFCKPSRGGSEVEFDFCPLCGENLYPAGGKK